MHTVNATRRPNTVLYRGVTIPPDLITFDGGWNALVFESSVFPPCDELYGGAEPVRYCTCSLSATCCAHFDTAPGTFEQEEGSGIRGAAGYSRKSTWPTHTAPLSGALTCRGHSARPSWQVHMRIRLVSLIEQLACSTRQLTRHQPSYVLANPAIPHSTRPCGHQVRGDPPGSSAFFFCSLPSPTTAANTQLAPSKSGEAHAVDFPVELLQRRRVAHLRRYERVKSQGGYNRSTEGSPMGTWVRRSQTEMNTCVWCRSGPA